VVNVFGLRNPFGLSGRDGDVLRRHVPDYLLLRRDGSVEVVDVKPPHLVDKPEVADVLRWTGQVLAEGGMALLGVVRRRCTSVDQHSVSRARSNDFTSLALRAGMTYLLW
jgi:hypothetical protein